MAIYVLLQWIEKRGHDVPSFYYHMESSLLLNRIEELIGSKSVESDIFFVEAKLLPGQKIEVFIDSDNGLTINKCAEISRFLKFHIEAENLAGDVFALEVSSPGIGKPLKLLRQYKKNIGRTLEISLLDGTKKKGLLIDVEETKMKVEETVKRNNKKVKEQVEIPFTDIKSAKVVITF